MSTVNIYPESNVVPYIFDIKNSSQSTHSVNLFKKENTPELIISTPLLFFPYSYEKFVNTIKNDCRYVSCIYVEVLGGHQKEFHLKIDKDGELTEKDISFSQSQFNGIDIPGLFVGKINQQITSNCCYHIPIMGGVKIRVKIYTFIEVVDVNSVQGKIIDYTRCKVTRPVRFSLINNNNHEVYGVELFNCMMRGFGEENNIQGVSFESDENYNYRYLLRDIGTGTKYDFLQSMFTSTEFIRPSVLANIHSANPDGIKCQKPVFFDLRGGHINNGFIEEYIYLASDSICVNKHTGLIIECVPAKAKLNFSFYPQIIEI